MTKYSGKKKESVSIKLFLFNMATIKKTRESIADSSFFIRTSLRLERFQMIVSHGVFYFAILKIVTIMLRKDNTVWHQLNLDKILCFSIDNE